MNGNKHLQQPLAVESNPTVSFLKNSVLNTQLTGKVFRFTDVGIVFRSKVANQKESKASTSINTGSVGNLSSSVARTHSNALENTGRHLLLPDLSSRKFSETGVTTATQTSHGKILRQLKQITDNSSGSKQTYLATPARGPTRLISDPSHTTITSSKAMGSRDTVLYSPKVNQFVSAHNQMAHHLPVSKTRDYPETSFYHELVDLSQLKTTLQRVTAETEGSYVTNKKNKPIYSERTRHSTQELSSWLLQQQQIGNNPVDRSDRK